MFKDSWENLSAPDHATVARMLDILAGGDVTPGMRAHQVGPFLSLSPNMDLRVIARRDGKSFILFYVDHHDDAYRWASSRSILATATLSHEVVNLTSVQVSCSNNENDQQLPIPISNILELTSEDQFLSSVADMSPEWQEWLLNAFTTKTAESPPSGSSLIHVISDDVSLKAALTFDFPNWQIFLHPTQETAANDKEHRSIAITGGPGTGKTVVLLNRLLRLSPKEKESDCSVLLSYSEGLSDYLQNQILHSSSRHAYVLPMYYLAGGVPQNARRSASMKKLKLIIENGEAFMRYHDGSMRKIREILVDEFQDAPIEVSEKLLELIASRKTRIVVASDMDQSIHRCNAMQVNSVSQMCQATYSMSYCFRSTRQIMLLARRWLDQTRENLNRHTSFALSGPKVRFYEASDLSDQMNECKKVLADLQNRYHHKDLALIYCQYFNPSFKGKSREEELLKNDPSTAQFYRFASLTKGKEYFAGILFVSESFLSKEMPPHARQLRLNTLYVALTRFRDELTIIYSKTCHIKPLLESIAENN